MYLKGERFHKEIYVTGAAAQGSGDGESYASAKAMVDGDLMVIPPGMLIERVFVVLDEAVTGVTNFDVGDDDDADGYVDGSLSITLNTPGLYGWNAKVAGAYLRVQTAGVTDPADIYVVPNSKYYAAAGKELKLDVTGTWTAGKVRVCVDGWYLKA